LVGFSAFAQFDYSLKGVPTIDRLRFGGYANVQFGTWTAIDISPSVGYLVSPRYMTGLGVSYIYAKYNGLNPFFSVEATTRWGVRNFHRFFLTESLFLWGEIEWLNYEYQNQFWPYDIERTWSTFYLVGGGYMSRFPGGRGGIYVSVLVNLNNDPNSPYATQYGIIPRIGVFF